jgi:hypothetical protein
LMILSSFPHVCLFFQDFVIGGRFHSSAKNHLVYILLQPIYQLTLMAFMFHVLLMMMMMCYWWFLQNLSCVCLHSKWRFCFYIDQIHGMCFNPFMID